MPAIRSGYSSTLNKPCKGRRTCASASALYLDAQPEQVANSVKRILRSLGVMFGKLMPFFKLNDLCFEVDYSKMIWINVEKNFCLEDKSNKYISLTKI